MVGTTVSHYRLEQELGSGGMGVVYRAHDLQLERTVAIKMIAAAQAEDPAFRDRLLREARAASALNHPNICTIHEVGSADGTPFIVMEFVEGKPLTALIPAGGLAADLAIRYAVQIADALAHAHARGVLHRDLKSANIVVMPDGRAKVLDFGLAERLRADELADVTRSRTHMGTLAGTLHYMAPEVLRGAKADVTSDVWALGVLLHEMVTGQLPFEGKTGFELSASILHEPPGPLPAQVGAGLRAVITRCLGKAPDQRYQQAGEVRAALEAIQSHHAHAPMPVAPVRPRRRTERAIAIAVMVVGLLAAGTFLLTRTRAGIDSIAVLPFTNATGDPGALIATTGLSETLTNSFSQMPNVRVVPRSVTARLGADVDPREAGRQLGVSAVLTGRVLVQNDRLNVQTELIDVRRGSQLWGKQYDGRVDELLAIQEAIATEVTDRLRGAGDTERRARATRKPTESPEAYEAYLQGLSHWSRRKEESNDLAIKYFNDAIKLDPSYALAYAGLANAYSIEGYYNWDTPSETFGKARGVARRAVELDPSAAESHFALAFATLNYDFNFQAADAGFRRALEIAPDNAAIRFWNALRDLASGRREEGVAEARRALEIDPFWQLTSGGLAWMEYYTGRYDEAIAQAQKTAEMDRSWVLPHAVLGAAYAQKKDYTAAIGEFQQAVRLGGPVTLLTPALGYALAASGRRAEAETFLSDLTALSKTRYVPAYFMATTYAGLGNTGQALQWLERAFADRSHWLLYLRVDPMLASVRTEPGVQDLIRRVGLP